MTMTSARDPIGRTRREFLAAAGKAGLVGAAAFGIGGRPDVLAAAGSEEINYPKGKAEHCIFVWLHRRPRARQRGGRHPRLRCDWLSQRHARPRIFGSEVRICLSYRHGGRTKRPGAPTRDYPGPASPPGSVARSDAPRLRRAPG